MSHPPTISSESVPNLEAAYSRLGGLILKHISDEQLALNEVSQSLAQALDTGRASIWRRAINQQYYCAAASNYASVQQNPSRLRFEPDQYPGLMATLAKHRVTNIYNAQCDPRTRELNDDYLKPRDINSVLICTILMGDTEVAFLCIESSHQQHTWNPAQQKFAIAVADLCTHLFTHNQLHQTESLFQALFEGTADAIFMVRNNQIISCNEKSLTLFGGSRAEVIGRPPLDFSPAYQPNGQPSVTLAKERLEQAISGHPQHFFWQHKFFVGCVFDSELSLCSVEIKGKPLIVGRVEDITSRVLAERKAQDSQIQLEHRALHDSLTGLPNRDHLHQHINQLIDNKTSAASGNGDIHVLLFDLNRFKEINDTLGHGVGDQLLIELGLRLQSQLNSTGGQLFRLGGDEFVAVSTAPAADLDLPEFVNQFLRTPLQVEGINLEMRASMGLAIYPEHGRDSHELLRCADVAMYHAKATADTSARYDPSIDIHSKRRLTMMSELGTAIRENQLSLHYQPRIELPSGRVTGCEALIRWQHPVHGMIPPAEFIPLAEMTDLIHILSLWVVDSAAQQIRRWQDKGLLMPVAVNLSARNLSDENTAGEIDKILRRYQLHSQLIEIEITESALIAHPNKAIRTLQQLDDMGIHMAIDDFGTGYSSLSYLKKLPISTLKIDRSFVIDMLTDDSDKVIVNSTIDLAHNFSLTVVAEGVEDEPTLKALAELGCDQAQGYFIAKPMPVDIFEKWLTEPESGYNLDGN